MDFIRIPRPLATHSAVFLTYSLWVAAGSFLLERVPWWKISFTEIRLGFWIAFGVSIVCAIAILRPRRWTIGFIASLLGLTALCGAVVAGLNESAMLALFTLAFSIASLFYLTSLREAFLEPYLNSLRPWYAGSPETIPGLGCDLKCGETALKDVPVSRINLDGAFLKIQNPSPSSIIETLQKMPIHLTIRYKGQQASAEGEIICVDYEKSDSARAGFGIRFNNQVPDLTKELADFLETLRGEGHVA